jgi:hypothetical protein
VGSEHAKKKPRKFLRWGMTLGMGDLCNLEPDKRDCFDNTCPISNILGANTVEFKIARRHI